MKIGESKNLKYDKMPWMGPLEGYEKFDPLVCILVKFIQTDDKLTLYFKNGSQVVIKSKNVEGEREIDLIADKIIIEPIKITINPVIIQESHRSINLSRKFTTPINRKIKPTEAKSAPAMDFIIIFRISLIYLFNPFAKALVI